MNTSTTNPFIAATMTESSKVQEQIKRIRKILNEIKLTAAYEHYGHEFERREAQLAAQGAANQCPYPLSR